MVIVDICILIVTIAIIFAAQISECNVELCGRQPILIGE
jgi:hypothetical protein